MVEDEGVKKEKKEVNARQGRAGERASERASDRQGRSLDDLVAAAIRLLIIPLPNYMYTYRYIQIQLYRWI